MMAEAQSCKTDDGSLSSIPAGGRVDKNAVIVIDTVWVQNLLEPFYCVLGKNTLLHFTVFGGLGEQS